MLSLFAICSVCFAVTVVKAFRPIVKKSYYDVTEDEALLFMDSGD